MKVYRPILGLVESIKALYIPRLGVIGYLTADIIDYYSDDPGAICRIQQQIAIASYDEFDLPEEEVLQVAALGRTLNRAKDEFSNAAGSLIGKIED